MAEAFTRHSGMLDRIFERLRSEPELDFLDREVYVELEPWRREVLGATAAAARRDDTPPAGDAGDAAGSSPGTGSRDVWQRRQRSAFYLCNSMIQLMENVYRDLALEGEWSHPDNRGWMSLFRHWARSPTFRQTWAVAASTLGARFQKFCRRHLGLQLGHVRVRQFSEYGEDLQQAIDNLKRDGEIHSYERRLIRGLVKELPCRSNGEELQLPTAAGVLLIQVDVLTARALDELARRPADDTSRPPADDDAYFRFTCGIAVLCPAITQAPVNPAAGDRDNKLVFLRLRKHLRNQGLGRRTLHRIFDLRPDIDVEALPEEVLREVYRPVDHDRFNNLFRSVKNERPTLRSRAGGGLGAPLPLDSGFHDVVS